MRLIGGGRACLLIFEQYHYDAFILSLLLLRWRFLSAVAAVNSIIASTVINAQYANNVIYVKLYTYTRLHVMYTL